MYEYNLWEENAKEFELSNFQFETKGIIFLKTFLNAFRLHSENWKINDETNFNFSPKIENVDKFLHFDHPQNIILQRNMGGYS